MSILQNKTEKQSKDALVKLISKYQINNIEITVPNTEELCNAAIWDDKTNSATLD